MTHILGYRDARCLPRATALGAAMRLTNVLRDVVEDRERGRSYRPRDELARFGVREEQITEGRCDDAFRELMRWQIARARRLFAEAESGVPDLIGESSRPTVRVMGRVYGGILGCERTARIRLCSAHACRPAANSPLSARAKPTRGGRHSWPRSVDPIRRRSRPMPELDPDRFFDFKTPGSQEWWYFDAISDDGEYALVIVWYAGLPFDPDYGLAALRHRRYPRRYPAPNPLDHSAIGLSLYRRGKTVAYALNRYPAHRFAFEASPFAVQLARSRFERSASTYRLHVETPAVDGRRNIVADLSFTPAARTESLERELGGVGGPHRWILAAADCRVEGSVALEGSGGFVVDFRGRGYHDHNAGSEELSVALTRWRWGRFHAGQRTYIFYEAEPREGARQSLWVVCEEGRPVEVRDDVALRVEETRRHPLGIRYGRRLGFEPGGPPARWCHRDLVDYGPFYLRWLSELQLEGGNVIGITALLEAKALHQMWFNWMIPYRLKRPPT
jgi:carotenoid 1,2-hydratase